MLSTVCRPLRCNVRYFDLVTMNVTNVLKYWKQVLLNVKRGKMLS